jgi:hypothetical protein
MWAPLCHSIDWLAIQLARRCPQAGVTQPDEARRVTELLAHPDFYSHNVKAPSDMQFHGPHDLSYTSPLPCPWPRNNTVHGRIYPAAGDWQLKPTVILLHGWNGELNYETLFPWMGRRLAQAGVNAISLLLPYHGRRKPREADAVRDFICDDLGLVLNSARQSIADVRALVRWLHEQGCPRIGLFGLSFGGWLTGLLACHEPLLSCAIPGTPIVHMDRGLRELVFCHLLKQKLEQHRLDVSQFDLTAQKPLLAPEHILLLASQYDLFAPAASVEALWHQWNQPEIWRVPHGHISVLFSTNVMGRVCDWTVKTLSKSPTATEQTAARK